MIGSDHRLLLVDSSPKFVSYKRTFRFNKNWLGKGLPEAVDRGWSRTKKIRISVFMDKIMNCRNSISWWRKNNVLPGKENIAALKEALEEAKNDDSI